MRGAFDDELEMPRTQRDTEVTLGAGMLLLLFFGLVLVCGLCFGLGYSVGHRGGPSTASNQLPSADAAPLVASGSAQKPSATTQALTPPPALPNPTPSDGDQPATAVSVPVAQSQAAPSASPAQIRPALPAPQASAPPASNAQPAAGALTVQVAAVSHQEDADVLVGALRKRNYEVSARREGDSLIHVRIGPFRSRDEANRWRLKLLNDGYNAIIQP